MEGDEFSDTRGVIPRAVQQIFQAAEKLGAHGWEVRARCPAEGGGSSVFRRSDPNALLVFFSVQFHRQLR